MSNLKLIFSIIGILLLCVLVVGALMQAFMPDGKKPVDWFDKTNATTPEIPAEKDNTVVEENKPSTTIPEIKPDDTPLDDNHVVATPTYLDLMDVSVMTAYANEHPEECYVLSDGTAVIRGQLYYIHNGRFFPCNRETVHCEADVKESSDMGYSYKFSPEETAALMRTTDEVITVYYTGEYGYTYVKDKKINLYMMMDFNIFSPGFGWTDSGFGECNIAVILDFSTFEMSFISMTECSVKLDINYLSFYGVVEDLNQGICDALMSDIDSLMALEGYEITFEEDSFELVSGGWQVKTIECEAGKQEELLKEMFNGYENVEYIGTDDIPYGVNIFDAEDPNEEGGVRHYLVNDSFYKYLEFNEISVYDLSEVDVSNSHNTFIGFYWEEGTDNIYAFATETDLIIVIYDSRK